MATVCDACGHKTNEVKSGCKFSVQQKGSWKAISCSWFLFVFHAFIHFIRLCLLVGSVGLVSGDCRGGRGFKNPSWCFIVVQVDKCSEILPTPDYSKIRGKIKTSANGQTLWSSQIRTVNRRPHLTTFNIHIPVGHKRTHTRFAKDQGMEFPVWWSVVWGTNGLRHQLHQATLLNARVNVTYTVPYTIDSFIYTWICDDVGSVLNFLFFLFLLSFSLHQLESNLKEPD